MCRPRISNPFRLMAKVLLMAFTVVALSSARVGAFSGDTVADRERAQFDMFHNGANTVDPDVMNQPDQIALDRSNGNPNCIVRRCISYCSGRNRLIRVSVLQGTTA